MHNKSKHFNFLPLLDGAAVVRVNIFVRSISKIDDVTMVSRDSNLTTQTDTQSPTHTNTYIFKTLTLSAHGKSKNDKL